MRAILLTCLLAAAAPVAAQTLDIRGLTCELNVGIRLEGTVQTEPLQLQAEGVQAEALPWTFDVLPDPAAPADPARLEIRLRLPTAEGATDQVRFELFGTYDAATGAIDAQGVAAGCHLWKTPFETDASGQLDAPATVCVMLRDPVMDLHVVVEVVAYGGDSQIVDIGIVGGDALKAGTVAAQFIPNMTLIGWVPAGGVDFGDAAIGPFPFGNPLLQLTSLEAHSADVFGDLTGDLKLTQADEIAMHKLLGLVTEKNIKADVTADGVVDQADLDYEQWLVRLIGQPGTGGAVIVTGTAGKLGGKGLIGKP